MNNINIAYCLEFFMNDLLGRCAICKMVPSKRLGYDGFVRQVSRSCYLKSLCLVNVFNTHVPKALMMYAWNKLFSWCTILLEISWCTI